ncbi:hypothetical protein [Pedobacter helvus]|uniref:Uncharacterized protein n=1 Tax=Pedobacter helvus TaxID=2563444 RepID=A0ABW9JJF3_9SPHI|nr:hypothetical protein [Pedobacter ureilyticus]
MDEHIILGRILQRFIDEGYAQVEDYNRFGYIRHTSKQVYLTRETGEDTPVSFSKVLTAIKAYQKDIELYDSGPSALRNVGITYVNSPIFALLHLLNKEDFV